MLWLLLGVGLLVLATCALLYNRLVKLRNRVDNAWSQVDVQLRRRYDLIPNLVATVKAYAQQESETLEAVVEARNGARSAATIAEQGRAESILTSAIGNLMAVAEAYPELRSVERFADLQKELSRTEDKISVSRHIYNDTTLNYNDAISTIPTNLVAALVGLSRRDYFQAEDDSRQAPGVNL
ncbi:MAG TPA: LemA family protein [Rubrobacter sp.]|nr:LemA family protein [Rubrobacter sp.]